MSKSCNLIQDGMVVFAQERIDGCCHCFEGGGSPSIIPYSGGKFPYADYMSWRNKALERIRAGDKSFTCTHCPIVQEADWGPITSTIRRMVITVSTTCQLDCEYCYLSLIGSAESRRVYYDPYPVVQDMSERGILAKGLVVSLGGGEITVLPNFDRLFALFASIPGCRIELPTNAVRLSTTVLNSLKSSSVDVNML